MSHKIDMTQTVTDYFKKSLPSNPNLAAQIEADVDNPAPDHSIFVKVETQGTMSLDADNIVNDEVAVVSVLVTKKQDSFWGIETKNFTKRYAIFIKDGEKLFLKDLTALDQSQSETVTTGDMKVVKKICQKGHGKASHAGFCNITDVVEAKQKILRTVEAEPILVFAAQVLGDKGKSVVFSQEGKIIGSVPVETLTTSGEQTSQM